MTAKRKYPLVLTMIYGGIMSYPVWALRAHLPFLLRVCRDGIEDGTTGQLMRRSITPMAKCPGGSRRDDASRSCRV